MKKKKFKIFIFLILFVILVVIFYLFHFTKIGFIINWNINYAPQPSIELVEINDEFMSNFVDAAIDRTKYIVRYDPGYVQIDYPMGDVPKETGVCTDVVIRSYRQLGVDLQKEVHEDIKNNFDEYPDIWGLSAPDTNIDHRRVPNLMIFFKRHGEVLPITENSKDYLPGDLVAWNLGGGVTHIGVVTNRISSTDKHPLIVHNIGGGPKLEDVLFDWETIGHFRYYGD